MSDAEMIEVLEQIAAECSVSVDAPAEMYKGWRKIACERVDIAREALKRIKAQ